MLFRSLIWDLKKLFPKLVITEEEALRMTQRELTPGEVEQGITIDIKSIDLEDPQTLALFASGKTKGIFQFEQAGAINLLKRIKPAKFEEVVATTSLNRPGASDYTDNFIARKYGKEKVDLIDPVVAPILEPTYGIMLYQEQVMQIAQVFAGFTLGKADLLRRAMSKKDANEMSKKMCIRDRVSLQLVQIHLRQ